MPTEIYVALISALGIITAAGLPAYLIERSRKENATDHAKVTKVLRRVEHKIDQHLEDHGNGTTRRNSSEAKSNARH